MQAKVTTKNNGDVLTYLVEAFGEDGVVWTDSGLASNEDEAAEKARDAVSNYVTNSFSNAIRNAGT